MYLHTKNLGTKPVSTLCLAYRRNRLYLEKVRLDSTIIFQLDGLCVTELFTNHDNWVTSPRYRRDGSYGSWADGGRQEVGTTHRSTSPLTWSDLSDIVT